MNNKVKKILKKSRTFIAAGLILLALIVCACNYNSDLLGAIGLQRASTKYLNLSNNRIITLNDTNTADISKTSIKELSKEEQNNGGFEISVTTDYLHVRRESNEVVIGNDESAIVTIKAVDTDLSVDDFILMYDESLLETDIQQVTAENGEKAYIEIHVTGSTECQTSIQIYPVDPSKKITDENNCYKVSFRKLDSSDGRIVYITPTGEKYHYSEKCAKKNAIPTTLYDVLKTYKACKKCVK